MNKKRILILLIILCFAIFGMVIYKSYICAILTGIIITLLAFSTVGHILYQRAIERMDKINQKARQHETTHPH